MALARSAGSGNSETIIAMITELVTAGAASAEAPSSGGVGGKAGRQAPAKATTPDEGSEVE